MAGKATVSQQRLYIRQIPTGVDGLALGGLLLAILFLGHCDGPSEDQDSQCDCSVECADQIPSPTFYHPAASIGLRAADCTPPLSGLPCVIFANPLAYEPEPLL